MRARLLSTLRRQKHWRRGRQSVMTSRARVMTSRVSAWRRENVTTMLVTVVTVFIICELPDPCLRLVYATVQLTSDPDDDSLLPLRYVNSVTNALLAFNSSVNFVIYFLVGRTFRRVFISSLACRRSQRRRPVVVRLAAAEDASAVAMATLRRHHVRVAAADCSSPAAADDDDDDGVVTSRRCHGNGRKREHVTVVAVDVER